MKKERLKKIASTVGLYVALLILIAIAEEFMTTKQLVGMGLFFIFTTDYRTDVTHDLIKKHTISLDVLLEHNRRIIGKVNTIANEVYENNERLSNLENKTGYSNKRERFTLED